MQENEVQVVQADREAAAEWVFIECRHCSEYEGDFPADLAQAFARHRQQAEGAMRERCLRICETTVIEVPFTAGAVDGASVALNTVATAIRAATLSKEVE